MNKYKVILLSLLFLCSGFFLFSQRNNFKSISIEQGLSQSTVYCVLQDSKGFLWLGTEGGGLSRYDGVKFKSYSTKNGLAGNIVRNIIEDKNQNLWIATHEGISVYDGIKFTTINQENGLSSNVVLRVFEDSKGRIWAGTAEGGLNLITLHENDSVSVVSFSSEQGLSSNFIFDIEEDKLGRLWLATWNGGITLFTVGEKNEIIKTEYLKKGFDIPSQIILSLEKDKQGNMWCGTYDEGAFLFSMSGADSGKVKVFPYIASNSQNSSSGLPDKTIWDIYVDTQGLIWFATNESGMSVFNGTNFNHYSVREGFPNNQVLDVFEDFENNLWFGTFGSGLCRLNGFNFSHYTEKDGLPNNQIHDIQQDKNNSYWLSAHGGGLTNMWFENGEPKFKHYTVNDGLLDNIIKSIAITSEQLIWVATENGISRFDGKRFINITERDGLVHNRVNCIYVDSKNNVWCGSYGGVSKLDSIGFKLPVREEEGLPNNEVQTIIEDSEGYIWFGTLGGLARTKGGSMTTYDEVEGLFDKRIHALAEDNFGNIWIGTLGGGLYLFDKNLDSLPIRLIANDSILSSNNIYSLCFLDDKTLLVATDKGFDKLTLTQSQNILMVRNYNKTDGFTGVENNLNALLKDNEGNVWFGTVNGLTKYVPKYENFSKLPPKTHITNLLLFFDEVDWKTKSGDIIPYFNLPSNLVLPYFENHLTFQFNGISLNNPTRVKYQYMLEGLDVDWSPPRTEGEAVYSGLSPGKYTFKVRAVNENGIWNQEPAIFSFQITPPFWQTIWFYSVCLVIILLGIYFFIKIREKKLLEEKMILEQTVAERTKEVVHQKEVIEEKNRDIMDSITYAKGIQEAILPSDDKLKKYLPDSFVLFRPRDIVSGDFYYMDVIEAKKHDEGTEPIVLFAVCDCTGHGVPGGFVSIVGHNGLSSSVKDNSINSPAEVLDNVARIVEETFKKGSRKDGMDAILCAYNISSKSLFFAAANNPLYYVRQKVNGPLSENGKVFEPEVENETHYLYQLNADKQPVGAYEFREPFTNHVFNPMPGDIIYLSTDGFRDQFGGPKGKKFMAKNFKQVLLSLQGKTMEEQKISLDTTIKEWMGEYEQNDDICVMGVKW